MKRKGRFISLRKTLRDNKDQRLLELFKDGELEIELYRPYPEDLQNPHLKDEVYIIIEGSATFIMDDQQMEVGAGDFLFVPAGMLHRFVNFTKDFATWVIFYGEEQTVKH